MGYHSLLQGIFPTQGSKLSLWHLLLWQTDSLPQSYVGSSKEDAEDTTIPKRQSWPKTTPGRAGNTLKDPRILHFCLPILWGPCHLTVAKSSSQDTRSRQTRRQKATGTFLVTQWLRLCFHYRGRGFLPGQGTRAHMLQLRPEAVKLKKKKKGKERIKRQWSRLWERKINSHCVPKSKFTIPNSKCNS